MAHLSNSGPPRLELNFSVTSLSIPSLESPKSFDATSLESGDSEYAEPPPNPTTSGPDSPQVYLSGWRLVVVIACLFFGALLMALDTNILNTAIPKISTEFHSLEDVAWYGTAYLLTITAFQPIYGSLYKYFTTDVVYRISIVVFEGNCPQVHKMLQCSSTSQLDPYFARLLSIQICSLPDELLPGSVQLESFKEL